MATEKRQVRPLTTVQKIAIERMHRLNELAEENVHEHPARSKRYVELIRGLSTRLRTSIPREIKDRFCKTCGNYWIWGTNVTRRVKGKTINFNCKICNTLTRRKVDAK
ncbi:MAG: ribonuclease P [archaeon]